MHPRDVSAARHRRPGRHRDRQAAALVAAAVILGASLTGAFLAVAGPRSDRSPADRGQVDLVGSRPEPSEPSEPSGHARATSVAGERPPNAAAALPARGPVVRAAGVLRAWDDRRARAWADGDVAALRDLYVDGAGARDVRLLRRYAERGYRVEGLTTQLLAVDVLERAPGRWRLRVTDRLASAFAVRGGDRLRLPRDGVDTHVVTLVRAGDGRWRVARARAT